MKKIIDILIWLPILGAIIIMLELTFNNKYKWVHKRKYSFVMISALFQGIVISLMLILLHQITIS